jgi:serine/threonine-protein kinase ATR
MTIHECQKHLLGAVQHYGTALQLGQKHVYQALPRLLAMWLEFTSLENGTGSNHVNTQDYLFVNQGLMNELMVTLSSKIPEHLFYTALPQLISRVIQQNVDTLKNATLIIRNVLAKYPQQAMWSCGWLRFSKSEEKKKVGEEIFQAAPKLSKRNEREESNQNLLNASKSLFQFFISLAHFMPKGTHTAVKMKVPNFDMELRNFIPPIQAALSLCPGALEGPVTTDVFPSFVPRMMAFNPEIKIMQSKAKPKKVSIFAVSSPVASRETLPIDGRSIPDDAGEMHFLFKQEAKCDLCKDSCVQDLNNVINRLLASRKGLSGPNSR